MTGTVGADPEFMLVDLKTSEPLPVTGLLGGTKGRPRPMFDKHKEGFFVQEDNVMAEFNVPPSSDADEFANNIQDGLQGTLDVVRTTHETAGICFDPAVLFPSTLLESDQAQRFGCSRDFDGHSEGRPLPAIDPNDLHEGEGQWRFAGGHVHIGYESEVPPHVAAQFADLFLGLYNLENHYPSKRDQFYGTAGRYRPKKYGIEYRSLPNSWIFSRKFTREIGQQALALAALLEGDVTVLRSLYQEIPWNDVRQALEDRDLMLGNAVRNYARHDLSLMEYAA